MMKLIDEDRFKIKRGDILKIIYKKYDIIYAILGGTFLLMVLLTIASVLDVINIDYKIPIRLGIILSIMVVFIDIFRYIDNNISKIDKKVAKIKRML